MHARRLIWAGLALVTTLASAREARAANDAAAAQALFEQARGLMDAGNYAAACAKFEGSQALDPGPGTQFNLALCYEKSGRNASAWAMYLEAAAAYKATLRNDWEAKSRDRANLLAPTLSRLTIVVAAGAPTNVMVTRDGVPIVASELGASIPVDPGPHVVDATARGRSPFHVGFTLAKSASRSIEITLPEAGAAAPRRSPTAPASRTEMSHTLAYVVGGAGVVGLGVGAVTGVVAINKNSSSTKDCPTDGVCTSPSAIQSNHSASEWATVSTTAFIAGGALFAAGVVLFFAAPTTTTTAASRPFVSPTIGLGTAGMMGAW